MHALPGTYPYRALLLIRPKCLPHSTSRHVLHVVPRPAAARGVPTSHQSTAVAVVTAASYAGTALAFGLAPTIIDKLGWPVRQAAH